MSSDFALKIFSPLGIAVQEQVARVTLPGADGQVTILPDHRRYVGLLGVGIVEYQSPQNTEPQRLVVKRGALSFVDNELQIIADAIFEPGDSEIDFHAQKDELENLLKKNDLTDLDRQEALDQLAAIAAIELLQQIRRQL